MNSASRIRVFCQIGEFWSHILAGEQSQHAQLPTDASVPCPRRADTPWPERGSRKQAWGQAAPRHTLTDTPMQPEPHPEASLAAPGTKKTTITSKKHECWCDHVQLSRVCYRSLVDDFMIQRDPPRGHFLSSEHHLWAAALPPIAPIQQHATLSSGAAANLTSTSSKGSEIMIYLWTGLQRAVKHTHSQLAALLLRERCTSLQRTLQHP